LPSICTKKLIEVRVPTIGDFKDVAVIELLIKVGDKINDGDHVAVLEAETAAPVPAPPAAGCWCWL
jgi:pyruvate/2-oxoglutarate dehydrogenase complex dihydrolipoamide acyltransferase (E2) component